MTDSSVPNLDQLEADLGALARSMTEEDRFLQAPPADLFPAILAEIRSGVATGEAAQYDSTDANGHLADPLAWPTSEQSNEPEPVRYETRPDEQVTQPTLRQVNSPAPAADYEPEQLKSSAETLGRTTAERQVQVPSLAQRRQSKSSGRGGRLLLAAAAAVALVAGGGFLATQYGSTLQPSGVTVASATLANDDLPVTYDQVGSVELIDNDGDLVLDVDVPVLPDSGDAFYEVWMIDANVEGMISLGVLTADGQIDVPDSVSPSDFPVVDISVEPLDGDPTHSGQSILRGVLEA